MKLLSRALALLLSVCMLLSAMPVFAKAAAADSFLDFPKGSWSEEAMTAAIDNGLLTGKANGLITPKDYLTRAEAATIINRAFGAKVEADISAYTDINPGDWYYSEFRKAVNMGTVTGVSANKLDPVGYITREQVLTVLARALVLDDQSASYLAKFQDGGAVSSWAKGASAAMVAKGYINGNDKGMLNPQGLITREEFAQIMHNIFKTYIPETVTINWGTYGTTVIRAKDVTLSNVTINGDLIVADGVANGNFTLANVTVTGRILFRGGEGAVKITNTLVGENVVINDVNGVVNFLNYRAESVFDGIKENTPATFLNMSVNTGGSGSSSPSREEYTVKEYIEELDGTYSLYNSTEKKDKYNEKIEYEPREITGFTFFEDHPDSVLEGKNNGKLTLKAYYKRNEYKVSLYRNETVLLYENLLLYKQNISDDTDLMDIINALVSRDDFETSFNTKPDGTGENITIAEIQVGAQELNIYVIETPIYEISYKLNGGSWRDGENHDDDTYKPNDGDYPLPVPTREDYVFKGWYENEDFTGDKVEVLYSGSTGNKTYYAKWIAEYGNLTLEAVESNDTVVIKIKLSEIPSDVENIAAIEIKIAQTPALLICDNNNITSPFGGTIAFNDGKISWYSTDPITSEELSANGNVLFELTYTIPDDVYGDVIFKLTEVWEFHDFDTKPATKLIVSTEPVTIELGNPPESSKAVVKLYSGTVRNANYEGEYEVETGNTLTTAQVNAVLGDPSTYTPVNGYTDSDGNVHKVYPELWYKKNGEWVTYVPEDVVITGDMDICLLTRYVSVEYTTDLTFKGIEIPPISATIAYDSNTDIGKSFLDALASVGKTMDSVLTQIENQQGVDLYEFAIEKAASKGLVDTDGNILNPNVPVPLHKFITEEMIMNQIDSYINNNIDDEEFIADILRNDTVVDMLLSDETIRVNVMDDDEMRNKLLTDDFIKSIIKSNPEFVDSIINSEDFVETIINNDATFDYIMEDDSLVSKVLENETFKSKIITKGRDYVVDTYFGTNDDKEVKDYITSQLKSASVKAELKTIIETDSDVKAALKETLETDEEAKKILKTKIQGMLDDPATEAEIRAEVKTYILNHSDILKDDIKSYIEGKKTDLKDDIKAHIQAKKAELQEDIKVHIQGKKAELQEDIKSYIQGKKADLKDDIKAHIQAKKAELQEDIKSYIQGKKADLKDDIESYIQGKKADLKDDIMSHIQGKKADLKDDIMSHIQGKKADLKDDIESYIQGKKADLKDDIMSHIQGKKSELKGDVKTYLETNKDEASIKTGVMDHINDNADDFKTKEKRAEVLANATVKAEFEAKYNNEVLALHPELSSVYASFDDFVAAFIDGSLEVDYPDAYLEVVNSYNAAIDENLTTYVEENYEDLFTDYFDTYFDTNYDSLFIEHFGSYYDENYSDLFDEYFGGYYDENFDSLFTEHFGGYYDENYSDLFDEYFSGYYDENYSSLFDEYFSEYYDENYSSLFDEYFGGYYDENYSSLFDEYFGGYYDENYGSLFDEYFGGYYDENYSDLFDEYFSGYYDENYSDLFDEYFSGYYDENYSSLFDEYFSGYYDDNYATLFNDNFSEYYDGLDGDEFKDLFNEKFDGFFTTQYSSLYDTYFDRYFDTMFDDLYEANVEKWAKIAYDEPTTHQTVIDTIEDVVEDLVDDYIGLLDKADEEETEDEKDLKEFIDKVIEEFDVKTYVRDNYATDADLKETIDSLARENAADIINDYADGTVSADIADIIKTEARKYANNMADDYVDGTIDADLKDFVDGEIDDYMNDLINDYIADNGDARETLGELIPTYAQDAVDALKDTDAFKNTIKDFTSGKGVRVNEGNLMFVSILSDLLAGYDYDKIMADFMPEKITKIVNAVGETVARKYVNQLFDTFRANIDGAIDALQADIDADIEGTEYKFSTSLKIRVNYMKDFLADYYNNLTGKIRDKINSQSKIPVSSNPYAQRLVDTDFFALLFDNVHNADEIKSGYKLKDDVMDYYNNALEIAVLIHDAVTYYGRMDEYTLEDKLDSASLLIGTYANKANDLIMNFIENGELPKGFTLEDILDLHTKIESLYNRFESKIEKGEDLYAEYLDRDYTNIIDLANMTVYADGKPYYLHEIILENGDDAFDVDDAATAIFESPNYRDISKIENAMAKVEAKIRGYKYNPAPNAHIYYVDAYRGTVGPKSIKGYSTGSHTAALQRYLRYIEN